MHVEPRALLVLHDEGVVPVQRAALRGEERLEIGAKMFRWSASTARSIPISFTIKP